MAILPIRRLIVFAKLVGVLGVGFSPVAAAGPCVNGTAGGFPCDHVDFLSHIPLDEFSSKPENANDIWGFYDLNSEREYAIIGLANGAAVVDVTDPRNPVEIDTVTKANSLTGDVKVYQFFNSAENRWQGYAYVSAEVQPPDPPEPAVTIIDLSELPNRVSLAAQATDEPAAHNIYIGNIDYETSVRLDSLDPILFLGGGPFQAYRLDDPLNPSFAGESGSASRGMHDGTSLVITDARKDQCPNATAHCVVLVDFGCCDDSLDLWDLTDPSDPRLLSSTGYANPGLSHSGWWSEDKQFVFLQDEGDESVHGLNTTLRVFSLADLAAPVLIGEWTGTMSHIDHNGYARGNRYYMSHYKPGLTVLDITDPSTPLEVGSFDTVPPPAPVFAETGAKDLLVTWGVYPFLPSGTILLSDLSGGLYMVADNSLQPAQGQLGFSDAIGGAVEGNTATLTVSRTGGTSGAVAVSYETLVGSADSSDFEVTSGTLSWAAGNGDDWTIDVVTTADAQAEEIERFFVRLFDPRGGATLGTPRLASLFVSDLNAMPRVEFDHAALSVREGERPSVMLVVRRLGSALGELTVQYRTDTGTATEGEDYVGVFSGQLSWSDQDATGKVIKIDLIDDSVSEEVEAFQVKLFNVTGGLLGTISSSTVEIQNPLPTAAAGIDRTVTEGSSVTLDGSQSSDPEGEALTFLWSQISGPSVALTNADQPAATLSSPAGVFGLLLFSLTVTDPAGNSSTDEVEVRIVAAQTSGSVGTGGGGGGGGGGSVSWLMLAVLLLGTVCAVAGQRRRPYQHIRPAFRSSDCVKDC